MSFLSFSALALLSFSGIFLGGFLAIKVREEMKTGSKFFPVMQSIIFLFAVSVSMYQFMLPIVFRIGVYALIILMLSVTRQALYPILAVLLALSSASPAHLFLLSSLIFLYGFPAGSMLVYTRGLHSYRQATTAIVVANLSFVPIAAISYFQLTFLKALG